MRFKVRAHAARVRFSFVMVRSHVFWGKYHSKDMFFQLFLPSSSIPPVGRTPFHGWRVVRFPTGSFERDDRINVLHPLIQIFELVADRDYLFDPASGARTLSLLRRLPRVLGLRASVVQSFLTGKVRLFIFFLGVLGRIAWLPF
jgi:hypothetical protein